MEKKQKKIPNNQYITTNGDLKHFSRQLETKNMTYEHFKKAYEKFKTPAYGTKEGNKNDKTGSN